MPFMAFLFPAATAAFISKFIKKVTFPQGLPLDQEDLDLSVRLLKLLADVINVHKTTGQGESLAQAKKVRHTLY